MFIDSISSYGAELYLTSQFLNNSQGAKIVQGITELATSLSALSAGTYLVKLQNSTKHEVFRFTKN